MAGRTTKKTENVEAVTVEEKAAPEKKSTTRKTKETVPEEKKTTAKSKTTTRKTAAEKKTAKETATKKAATTKKTATTKKAATVKEVETAEEKETKRKTTIKKVEKNVVFEFHGVSTQIDVESYENKVKDIWLNDWNRLAKDLKTIDLYIKPEDRKVYFVINNGTDHGAIDM